MNKLFKDIKTMNYGIIRQGDLPGLDFEENIIDYKGLNFAEMKNFNSFAKNHCGATFVTNLAAFFEHKGYDGLLVNGSLEETFKLVHSKIGNGPIMFVAPKARAYFKSRGYDLKYRSLWGFKEAKDAIKRGNPLAILLAENPISWHWVMGLGTLETGKSQLFRVMNAWENTGDRYYLVNNRALFFSAKEYYLD